MGAIAGMIGLTYEGASAEKILELMKRRAPGTYAAYFGEKVCLLSRERQSEETKKHYIIQGEREYVICWDGYLYHKDVLIRKIQQAGMQIENDQDTQLVLCAYSLWGENCTAHLEGGYAFAIWEKRSRTLFLARDPMGIRPLFYRCLGDGFQFGSELKMLLACPGAAAYLDQQGIAQLLMLGPGRIPGSGILHGYQELKPGCRGTYHNGTFYWNPYWKLRDREHTESFDETVEHVRALVEEAVAAQSDTEENMGTFLSGGLDSSIISSICADRIRKKQGSLSTFSIDFEENERFFQSGRFQPSRDTAYIKIMEQYLQAEGHFTVISAQQQFDALEEAMQARDFPGMADVDSSLLIACEEVKKQVSGALSGECADEIFGGYPWYRDPEIRSFPGFPWSRNLEGRMQLIQGGIFEGWNLEEWVREHYEKTIRDSDILPGQEQVEIRTKQMVNLNMWWFMQNLLERTDRMRGSLEVRMPFCDVAVAEYLYGVPWRMKDYGGTEKGLLRKAFQNRLPEEIVRRKKSPYPKSYDPAYLKMVEDRMQELLTESDTPIFQIVKKEKVQEWMKEDWNIPFYGQLMQKPQMLAYLLQMNLWMETYGIRRM